MVSVGRFEGFLECKELQKYCSVKNVRKELLKDSKESSQE